MARIRPGRNHFQSYTWEDLTLTFYGLDLTLVDMEWTQSSWEDLKPLPPSEFTSWKDVGKWESPATSELHNFRENWNGMNMTLNASSFPCLKVKQRYIKWDSLLSDMRVAPVQQDVMEHIWHRPRCHIAGEGEHTAGGAQSANTPPWFCDKLGVGDGCS